MSRFCILTNTKEFKNAQLKFNLDKYSLEKIVYNYYNNVVNSENTFPSDDYINSIINPTIIIEDKRLVDFSKKHGYDKPLIFNSLDNFESKLKEVQQFFTSDLIITYTNFKGQSVIKVANFEYKEKEQKQTKLDKELEEIKRNAIANGTFMKAPNGQPTNLNERQWLQVRTKAFKEWFGDWEKLAQEKQSEMDFTKELQEFENSNTTIDKKSIALSNLKPNEKSDEQVLLDAGYKKVGNMFVSPDFDKTILSIIPTQLLKIMEKCGIRVLSFGKGDYSAMSGGIKVNGHSIGEIKFTTDNDASRIAHNILHEVGHYLYSHYLNESDKNTASVYNNPISLYVQNLIDNTRTSGASIGEENFVEGFATYFHNKIFGSRSITTNIEGHLIDLYRNLYKEFGNNNDVSKVVDENGEPLVVYSGRPYKGTTDFTNTLQSNRSRTQLTSTLKKGVYFSKDRKVAQLYEGSTIYNNELDKELKKYGAGEDGSVFLNKEEFLKYHPDISNEHYNILLNRYNEVVNDLNNPTGEFLPDVNTIQGETVAAFLNIREPFEINLNGKSIAHLSDKDIQTINNSEGAIIREVDEHTNNMPTSQVTTDYIVFNPNQIKSATDNNGEFSTENDDIYKENIPFENEKAIGKPDSKLLQMFAKRERVMLSGNKELTAKDLLLIIKDSRYSSIITLLKALNKIGELDNIKVQLVSGSARSFNRRRAYYNASEKTIYVNTKAQYEDGNSSSVLLHEILHSITVDRIQQNPELRKEILDIMNEYQAVYYDSKYDTRLDSILNGHHAMEEFIADVWSNPETINNLKNVKTKENKNKSLWDRFKQFFHNLFSGIFLGTTNDSLFAKASSSIIKLLETQAESIAVGKYYENGVPIKPNAEQELAIDIMTDYVTDRIEGKQTHPFFLLNGKAGTGKTTIINMLLERLNKEGKLGNVIVAAVANKAKQNLFRKTNYRELKIKSSSIAGILGKGNFLRQQGSGTGYERMSTKKFGAVIENSDLKGPENIIVIDECSMIETKDYEALLALLALRNLTLIFVGDSGQLPQIQNNKAQSNTPVSKTFTESSINASATLLTRVRQGEDNPILAASDLFYVRGYEVDNSDPKRNLSLAKLDTKITDRGAFILKNNDQFDYEKDASALFKRAIETGNTNLVKYVCATNEEVSSFNDLVRRSVFGKEYTKMFKEGDIVMFREQFSAKRSNNPNGKAEKIDNSQEGIIKSFEEISNDDVTSREGYLSPFVLFCKKLNDYAEKHDDKVPLSVDEMGEELTKLWKELPVISTFIYDEKTGTPFYEGTDGKLYNVLETIYRYSKRIKDIKPVRSVSVEMETQSETASEPGLYEMLTIHPEDWEQYEKNIKLLQDNTYFDETNIIQVITRQLFNAIGLKGSIDLKVLRQLGAEMINNSYTNTRARLQYGYAITSHKSQGSTYDVSIINGDSMGKNKTWGFQDKQRMMYTAITRSSNVTMVITNDAFGIRDTEPLDIINERINANKKKTGIDHTGETYKPENIDRTDNTPQTSQTPLIEDKVKTINIDGAATEIEYKYINEKTDKLPQRSADGSIMMYNVSRDDVLQYLFSDNSYKEALDKLALEGYNRNYINSIISNDNAAESFVLLNQYIGFIFKDKYKCLKEVFNQLAKNTGNLSPEVEQHVVENVLLILQEESRAKYENPFILEKSEINSENSIYPAEYVLSVNLEYLNAIEERADNSMKVLSKFLDGVINFSNLPFGVKIRINTGNDRLDVKIQQLFRKNRLLHITTEFRTIDVDLTTKEGANFVTYLKNIGVISRSTGTLKSGSVVSKVGIYAYTYVKKQRDIENSKQIKELNDKVSGRRLRSLSIGAIYKISELVTQIQDGDSVLDTLFTGEQLKEVKELRGKDRITIIGKIGISGLALIVKDRYFNVNASDETRNKSLDSLNRKKRKEVKAIYDNFEAFINFGYAKLEELEGVSVNANSHMSQSIIELYDGIDEQEVQELYGSSLEHWLVGFRSVSAVMNLSRLVKSVLNNMYDYDINFNVVKDEYGLEKRVNAAEAVSNMLSWFTSVENVDDMVKVLQQKMEKHPWLAQLVNDDPDFKDSEGNLISIGKLIAIDKKGHRYSENEEFRSKFFRNMYLYFQRYGIIQADGNIKVINDKSDISSVTNEILTNTKANKELFNNNVPVGNSDGSFVNKLIQARKKIADRLNVKGNVEIDDEIVKDVKEIFNLLGINLFSEEAIKAVLTANPKYLIQLAKSTSTSNGIANLFLSYNRDSKAADDDFWKSYKNDINKIIKPFTDFIANRMESVTYQDGKLYYSYVLPSYMSKFNTKIKNGNGFMEKEFKSEFFGLTKDGKKQWLNEWLERLATEDKAREDFSHKAVLVDNGVSYTKKTPKQYMSSILNEYLYDRYKRLAWYRIPMMSNKPSEEYIRFYRYTEGFKSLITDLLVSTTMQEILRISDVLNRAKSVEAGDLSEDSIIKFYDIKTEYKKEAKDRHSDEELIRIGIEQGAGTRFIMLSFLQPYILYALDNKEYQGLGRLLLNLILGNNTNTEENSESELESNPIDFFGGEAETGSNTTLSLLRTAIMHEMNNNFREFLATMEAEGVIEQDKKGNYKTDVKKLGSTNNEILNTLEEFFWNDFYAATSILLLYVTDPAYYGTAEELQKRLAQLHAPGSRLNVLARDKNGKLYSANENGKHVYRQIKLADDKIISDAISNVNEVFDLLVKENNGNAPAIAYYEAQRKFIISELKKVNVTDAQTFCTPTAMRKKLGMLGEWNESREKAYQNLVKGTHTKSDLSILMQPLKPFMFSQKQASESGGLFNTRRVGVQVKTSEYLLLLVDAITRGAGKKTKLATIFDVIEETLTTTDTYGNKVPNGKGIDGISFESSIKTGLSGIINLNGLTNELVEQTLRRCIYAGSDGTNTTSLYNKTFVDELDYEDYSIQQEVPTHFFGKQQLGSQSKALMFADTEEYERDENGKYRKDEDGNKVDRYIYVKDKKGNRVRTTVREAKQRYFRLLADSINNAKEKLIKELNLDNANEGIQNIAISELLKKQILEDSRFGSDLLWAVDTNEKGEFNLPLSDPTHSVRIQQLLYAVIKNRIYKQEIHGGPVVLVSNWGNEDLHIRYTNRDGETLLTEEEFNSLKERAKNVKNIKDEKAQRAERASILDKLSEHASTTVNINGKTVSLNTYEQYKKHHMVDGGVVYECYAPVYDERLLKYENEKGIIDVKRIRQEEPQLLELIGYRIPTEAKYSMASLRIVGFLPREAGEGIMLPKEWTSISGSDFDVDKLYIMRRSFIEVGDEENGLRWEKGTTKQDEINDEIFDIMQGVLESNQALSKVVKIGTFDPLKVVGYKLAALRELKAQNQRENILIEARNKARGSDETIEEYKEFKDTYDSLPNNINALKDLAIKSKNLAMAHVHLQFFKLNMVAAKLIGVFAQSNISHAYLQMYASSIGSERGIQIEDLEFAQFNLFGQLIHKDDFYIDSLYGFDGTPISDNIAAFLAASVDAVKDPILNLMNVNMKTVNAVMMMARMGFNIEQIGLLFGQDIVTRLTQRMDKYGEMFSEAIENELKTLQKLIDADRELSGVKFDLNLSDEELKLNLIKPSLQLNYTILKVLQQINKISDDTRSIVHMTRFNSISSAKGPDIIEAIVEQFKTDAYWRSLGDKNYSLNTAILNPVLSATTEAVDSLERMLIGNRFVLAKSHFAETYKTYVLMIGRDVNLIDKKDAKRFSDFYIDYMIHKVSNLFNLSYEHRLEVVSTYPKLILALKSDPRFTDNKFVQSIQQRQDKKDKYLGINIELLGVTSDNIEEIKTDFNEFADEEPEMTRKLIEYMFNRGGFSFSPKTFTNLITNYIKNKLMPEYLKNVRELEKENGYLERKDNVELMELSDDIIYQYMLHYGAKNFRKADVSSLDDLELPKSKNDTTDLTLGDTFTIYNGIIRDLGIYLLTLPMKNPLKSTDRVFLTVKVDSTTRNGISIVTVVEKLGGDGLGIEINPDEDVVKSIYNLEKDDNNIPPEIPSPTEPNKPSDSISNPIDNDYYESLDEVVQDESVRNSRGNSRTNEFLKFKSNPLAGGDSYLALLLNADSQQPVTNAVLNTDIDIEEAVESAVNMVNETETYPILLQLDYADSLTQIMVDMGTITLEQGNNSAETDRQSTNCK